MLPHIHCKPADGTINISGVLEAFRTAAEIVAGMFVTAGALPGSDQLYRVAAESADQVIDREFAATLAQVELHGNEVIKIKAELRSDDARSKFSRSGKVRRVDYRVVGFTVHANLRLRP